ncbi:MAG: N-6 DNA methylase [Ruminococcus flavefaciens]
MNNLIDDILVVNYEAAKSALYEEVRKFGCFDDSPLYGIAYVIAKNSKNPTSDLSSIDAFLLTNPVSDEVSDFLRTTLTGKWDIVLRLKAEYPAQQFIAFLLLENELSISRFSKGVNTTTISIVDLAERILDVKPNDKVADLCCGYGSFIVRSFINESNATYTGIEFNISAKAVAEMRSDILGSDITILTNDVMTYEAESKFDKIFSDPPYGVTTFNVENASNRPLQFLNQAIPGLSRRYSSNLLFATAVLNNLSENGKAVVCVTPNAAFGTGDVEVRRFFVEHGFLESVIALPANMIEGTAIPILLLVLSYGNSKVSFVDASEVVTAGRRKNTLSDVNISTIIDAIAKDSEISKVISNKQILENKYELHPSRYLTKLPEIINGTQFGSVIKNIGRGAQIKADELDKLVTDQDTGIHYIMLTDIQDGIVNEELPYLKELPVQYEKYCVGKEGAFIMSKAGPVFKAAYIQSENEKILVNGNMYIIKLDDQINPIFLKAFIESEEGQTQLRNLCVGTTLLTISANSVKDVIIPLPDMDTQNVIAEKYSATLDEIKDLKEKLRKANEERMKICKWSE